MHKHYAALNSGSKNCLKRGILGPFPPKLDVVSRKRDQISNFLKTTCIFEISAKCPNFFSPLTFLELLKKGVSWTCIPNFDVLVKNWIKLSNFKKTLARLKSA